MNISSNENERIDELAAIEKLTFEAIDAIRSDAEDGEASKFATDLQEFVSGAMEKALVAKKLRGEIEDKERQIAEARLEFEQLLPGRPRLAGDVNDSATKYEDARYEYGLNEFKLASLEDRISMRRSEIASLNRQIRELADKQKENLK